MSISHRMGDLNIFFITNMENSGAGSREELYKVLLEKMKRSGVAEKVTKDSAVFLGATIEFLADALLYAANDYAKSKDNPIIEPSCIRKAIDNDLEFSILLRSTSLVDTHIEHRKSSIGPAESISQDSTILSFTQSSEF